MRGNPVVFVHDPDGIVVELRTEGKKLLFLLEPEWSYASITKRRIAIL